MLTSRRFGCIVVRQRGSHVIIDCRECRAVVPLHGKELASGTWADIGSTLTPCLGEKWWQ